MKVYILVEGKETEPLFYPALFNYFLPNYTQCRELDQLSDDSYYIISGLGMPRTFQRIENCLKDICDYNQNHASPIDLFVVVFDSDRYPSMTSAKQAITNRFRSSNNRSLIQQSGIHEFYIIQNPCIETWFLANKGFFPCNITTSELKKVIAEFDILSNDPELLCLSGMSKADSASYYLDCIFKEKGYIIGYNKKRSMKVIATNEYISEIVKGFESGNINSFSEVKSLMNSLL